MKIKVGAIVMLKHPFYPENQGRIGEVVLPISVINHEPVEDTWLVQYPRSVRTNDGMYPFSCSEGWRLLVISPGDSLDIQPDVEVDEALAI